MNVAYGAGADWRVLTGTVAAHGLLAVALLSMEPVARAVGLDQPLLVSLIEPVSPEPVVEPPKQQPKPKPTMSEPVKPELPPILATPVHSPAPVVETMPESPIQVMQEPVRVAAPTVSAPPVPASALALPAVAPPVPVIPPDFAADYLDNPKSNYPNLARRLGEQGKVFLRVLVEADGNPSRIELKTSSGFERLDAAARETVQRWRFVPARQGTQAVSAWVVVPVSFSLRG